MIYKELIVVYLLVIVIVVSVVVLIVPCIDHQHSVVPGRIPPVVVTAVPEEKIYTADADPIGDEWVIKFVSQRGDNKFH